MIKQGNRPAFGMEHPTINTILVKVDQLKRGWGFYFTEKKTAFVTDRTISKNP
jgi:hypothetical protein